MSYILQTTGFDTSAEMIFAQQITKLGGQYKRDKVYNYLYLLSNQNNFLFHCGSCLYKKVYAAEATHLIVKDVNTSEKMLAFVAAGKWILTPSYIQASVNAKCFLDELPYHIFLAYPRLTLAHASYQ
jgi:hypothetical protein